MLTPTLAPIPAAPGSRGPPPRDPVTAVVDRWDDPRYDLRMTRAELVAAARAGTGTAASAEAGIRRMIPAHHEGLVVRIAGRRTGRGLDLDDLKQEGFLGLIRAAEKFDPGYRLRGRPVRFSQYAGRWAKDFMELAIRDNRHVIRIPTYLGRFLEQIGRGTLDPESLDTGRRELVRLAGEAIRHAAARDNPRRGRSWADVLPDPRPVADPDAGEDLAILETLVAGLGRHERIAITLRFGLDGRGERTFKAIGAELGVEYHFASQIVARALDRLKVAASAGT